MDPITLAAGAIIALVSLGIGRVTGRRQRRTAGTTCEGCQHGLSYHDDHGKCHATNRKRNCHDEAGGYLGTQDIPCTCQQYVGNIPADRMLSTFTRLPPTP